MLENYWSLIIVPISDVADFLAPGASNQRSYEFKKNHVLNFFLSTPLVVIAEVVILKALPKQNDAPPFLFLLLP
jgi:hypothetical protein